MPDLSDITAQFTGGEWLIALAAPLRQAEMDRECARRLLHDQVGPLLSSAGLQLQALGLNLQATPSDVRLQIAEIQRILDHAVEQVRAVSRTLKPSSDARFGLRSALERLAADRMRDSGMRITLELPIAEGVSDHAGQALSRIAHGSVRYAAQCGVQSIQIRIVRSPLGWMLEVLYDKVTVQAEDPYSVTGRCELALLHYEAISCGASVSIDSTADGGEVIRATCPAAR